MKHRNDRRQRFFAIILLMVMTLQMGVKTFHVHHHGHTTEFSCSDCEHHRVHNGHILAWDGHTDDCPLCLMLASPYVPVREIQTPLPPTFVFAHGIMSVPAPTGTLWCQISPRGPPSSLL